MFPCNLRIFDGNGGGGNLDNYLGTELWGFAHPTNYRTFNNYTGSSVKAPFFFFKFFFSPVVLKF